MGIKLNALVALAAVVGFSTADAVGYFDDSSVCADPDGLATCYEKAENRYTSCITNNCAGGSSSCMKSCDADANALLNSVPTSVSIASMRVVVSERATRSIAPHLAVGIRSTPANIN
ncbi:unnamed protein product [Penicillium pancosmium]